MGGVDHDLLRARHDEAGACPLLRFEVAELDIGAGAGRVAVMCPPGLAWLSGLNHVVTLHSDGEVAVRQEAEVMGNPTFESL